MIARFDVRRSDKVNFTVAAVTKVDFSGTIKRIMFHFAKTSSDRDEWIELGSPRIAPRYSKVPKKGPKSGSKVTQPSSDSKPSSASDGVTKKPAKLAGSKPAGSKTPRGKSGTSKDPKLKKEKCIADPTDEKSFIVGGKSLQQRQT